MRWLIAAAVVVVVVVAVVVAGWAATEPEPRPTPDPAAAATVPAEMLCREYGKATLAMADHLDRAFEEHADAHRAYRDGKMPFGDPKNLQPGTVLWVWHKTLHARKVHAVHYRELRRAWRRACLAKTPTA